jgi:hypothetical protein
MSDKPIPSSRMGNLFSKKDPAIVSHESRVMKHEHETAEQEPMNNESRVMNHDTDNVSHESLPMKHESGIMNIDPQALNSAVAQGRKDPRISAYSPLVMSVLRYLRKTTPEFSMSDIASSLLEEAIRKQYPEISKQVDKALNNK